MGRGCDNGMFALFVWVRGRGVSIYIACRFDLRLAIVDRTPKVVETLAVEGLTAQEKLEWKHLVRAIDFVLALISSHRWGRGLCHFGGLLAFVTEDRAPASRSSVHRRMTASVDQPPGK